MARLRAAALLIAASALLLSGCSSPGSPDAAPGGSATPDASDASAPPAPGPGPAPPATPPAVQEEDLAWTLGTQGCAEPPVAWEQLAQAYRPELDGVTFQSAVLDEATQGGTYDVVFALAPGTFGVSVVFWSGAVGPDGDIVATAGERYDYLESTVTISGLVPNDAQFVTAASCGPLGSTAHYVAQNLADALVLLG